MQPVRVGMGLCYTKIREKAIRKDLLCPDTRRFVATEQRAYPEKQREVRAVRVNMTRDIQPLMLIDLPELSRFLATGFQASPLADFAAPEVLRWKYLEPSRPTTGQDDPDAAGNHEGLEVSCEAGQQ